MSVLAPMVRDVGLARVRDVAAHLRVSSREIVSGRRARGPILVARQLVAWTLRHHDGLTVAEISAFLHLSRLYVYHLIRRAQRDYLGERGAQ